MRGHCLNRFLVLIDFRVVYVYEPYRLVVRLWRYTIIKYQLVCYVFSYVDQ